MRTEANFKAYFFLFECTVIIIFQQSHMESDIIKNTALAFMKMFYLSDVVQSLKGHIDLKLPRVDKVNNVEKLRKQTKKVIEKYLANVQNQRTQNHSSGSFDNPNDVDEYYDIYYQFYLKFFDHENENFTKESDKRKLTLSERSHLELEKSGNKSEL